MEAERVGRAIRRTVRSGTLRRRHVLPSSGRILVHAGDEVVMGQVWGRGRMRAGVTVVDLPRLLSAQLDDVSGLLKVSRAEIVEEDTLLAEAPGRMGIGRQWRAPARGMIASVSARTGVAVFVREVREVALHCRLAGTVVGVTPGESIVIEGQGVAIAGALGAGGRAVGPLRVVESGDRPEDVADVGEILVTPDPLRPEWMQRAVEARASAVIAPSADDATLSELALAPTIVGLPLPASAPLTPPVPTLLTEGFGHIRMPRALQRMFRASADELVSVVGSRQPGESEALLPPGPAETIIAELGANGLPVRIVAGPDAGEEGVVVGPAPDEARAPSGSPALCVRVQRAHGGTVTVPAANCEAIA